MRIIPFLRSFLFAMALIVVSTASFGQIGVSIEFGPPALPVYEQPFCPGDGYLWTPGYWAYGEDDYYWVPGTWVEAPEVGYLWTPPYWGWGGNGFLFHEGYWGTEVGFYGGISYGYGYFGRGYEGGRWDHDRFFYNSTVNNINVTNIHNTYNTTIINNNTNNHVSYNGGNGGIEARPTRQEESAANARHVQPVAAQRQHEQTARVNPELRASANQGRPPIAATGKPGDFRGSAVPAKEAGAPYHPPANRAAGQPSGSTPTARPENNVPRPPGAMHAKDIQPHTIPTPQDTGNPKLDQKYQQQQQKLYTQQNQDHQKLQQKQEQDHQRQTQQNATQARNQQVEQKRQQQTQQVEQRHQQQTQQLEQRHAQQTQHVEQRQAQQQQRQQGRQQPNHNEQRPGGGGGKNP